MYVCECMRVCVCVSVYMYVSVCVCESVCACVCESVCGSVCVRVTNKDSMLPACLPRDYRLYTHYLHSSSHKRLRCILILFYS